MSTNLVPEGQNPWPATTPPATVAARRTTRSVPRGTWAAVLVVGVGLFEVLRHILIRTQNPNLVPTLILVGALVAPAAFVAFVYGRRLDYAVTGGVLATIALVGGIIGVSIASLVEYDTLRDLGTLPMAAVALIEETAKIAVPVAVLIFGRYRRPADGLLIGVACGAGFAVLETMGYAFVALISSKGNLSAVDGTLILRGLLSPAGHMAWTGLAAVALFAAAADHWARPAVLRLVAAFVAAVVLHTAWDSIGTLAAFIVLAVLGLGTLGLIAHRLHVTLVRAGA